MRDSHQSRASALNISAPKIHRNARGSYDCTFFFAPEAVTQKTRRSPNARISSAPARIDERCADCSFFLAVVQSAVTGITWRRRLSQ